MTAQPVKSPVPDEEGREIQFRWSQVEDLVCPSAARGPAPETVTRVPGQAADSLRIVKGVAQYLGGWAAGEVRGWCEP